jgi:hypothetical protein
MKYCALLGVLLLIGFVGCGGAEPPRDRHRATQAPFQVAQQPPQPAGAAPAAAPAGDQPIPPAAAVQRQVISTAEVKLVVEDFSDIPKRVTKLVEECSGYIAESQVRGATGSARTGSWKIRVPVEHYERLLDGINGLGSLHNLAVSSEDVTAEYYDLDARIRNKEREEQRLLKILEENVSRLDDIRTLEKEISRVREEIERMQGRIRVIRDLAAMSTVNLQITEVHDYVAPAPVVLTFSDRMSQSFATSWGLLVTCAQQCAILFVVLAPWLLVLTVLGTIAYGLWRVAMTAAARSPAGRG